MWGVERVRSSYVRYMGRERVFPVGFSVYGERAHPTWVSRMLDAFLAVSAAVTAVVLAADA